MGMSEGLLTRRKAVNRISADQWRPDPQGTYRLESFLLGGVPGGSWDLGPWKLRLPPAGEILQLTAALARHGKPPSPVRRINESIEASEWLLGLRDDWDEEGAKAPTEETWNRATGYLRNHAMWAARRGLTLPPPRISACADGSIDMHWEHGTFEMLINFPAEDGVPGTFYADNLEDIKIKGTFNPLNPEAGPSAWLAGIGAKTHGGAR